MSDERAQITIDECKRQEESCLYRLLPPREIAKSFVANGMIGRGGGDRNYLSIGNKGVLRRSLAF